MQMPWRKPLTEKTVQFTTMADGTAEETAFLEPFETAALERFPTARSAGCVPWSSTLGTGPRL